MCYPLNRSRDNTSLMERKNNSEQAALSIKVLWKHYMIIAELTSYLLRGV